MREVIIETVGGKYRICKQPETKNSRLKKQYINQHNMSFKVNKRVEELIERYGSREAALEQSKQMYKMMDDPYNREIWERVIDDLSEE